VRLFAPREGFGDGLGEDGRERVCVFGFRGRVEDVEVVEDARANGLWRRSGLGCREDGAGEPLRRD
jgi:hypothetical protein